MRLIYTNRKLYKLIRDTIYDTMKHIHITLEDWEYKSLIKDKGEMTWHDFLMRKVK